MPEKTSDGKWKWGNVKRNSRKELAQTVYGIWKGNGGKGSFHNFYHNGNEFRTSKKKKMKKESYQINPLFLILEGKELDHILGTITDEREKAFLVATRKISKEFNIIKNITRDDNCIYINLKDNCRNDKEQFDQLQNALNTLAKGFHFGKVSFYNDDIPCFAIISCPTNKYGEDSWKYIKES